MRPLHLIKKRREQHQKLLTAQLYHILNTPVCKTCPGKAQQLTYLSETSKRMGLELETKQILQVRDLYLANTVNEIEKLEKQLAHQQAINKTLDLEFVKATTFTFRKTFEFTPSQKIEKSASDGFYYLHGYISDGSVDRDGDKMGKRALQQMKDSLPGLSLFGDHNHGWTDTLGVFTKSEIDGRGLWAEVRLESPDKNPLVASLLHKLETGERLGLSIGGDMDGSHEEKEYDEKTGRTRKVRVIDGVKLYETSVVGLPANANAVVTDITYR